MKPMTPEQITTLKEYLLYKVSYEGLGYEFETESLHYDGGTGRCYERTNKVYCEATTPEIEIVSDEKGSDIEFTIYFVDDNGNVEDDFYYCENIDGIEPEDLALTISKQLNAFVRRKSIL